MHMKVQHAFGRSILNRDIIIYKNIYRISRDLNSASNKLFSLQPTIDRGWNI